jgi:hypothetical protein
MKVSARDLKVEFDNDFVPVQDAFRTKVSGLEIVLHSIELLRRDLAMIATLELGVLPSPREGILDGILDLLSADLERSGNGSFGPFNVVVFATLDIA